MTTIELKPGADLDGFRSAIRWLTTKDVSPAEVNWRVSALPDTVLKLNGADAPPVVLPAAVLQLSKIIVCHSDPERYALLHSLIWRIRHGERHLLEVASDPIVNRLSRMRKAVARDIHHMHAYLRFHRVRNEGSERFVAWFEPQHFILDEAVPFFVSRFPSFEWSILTPIGARHWNLHALTCGGPAQKPDLSAQDDFENAWIDYYRSTFNPARTNVKLMQAEMPKKYWANMPEAAAIPELVRGAADRVQSMLAASPSMPNTRIPDRAVKRSTNTTPASLEELNAIIKATEPFVAGGRTAVLGEGPMRPAIAFVGEQPGDQEDLQGRPFVGPAGQVFDRALAEAGIAREEAYVTNAVKHFKFTERGKRRIHQKPTMGEIKHYRWWLQEELSFVRPKLVVALGASAAFALAGRPVAITRERGPMTFSSGPGVVTIHPSFILRIEDAGAADQEFKRFVADLRVAAELSHRAA